MAQWQSNIVFLEKSDFDAQGRLKTPLSKPLIVLIFGDFCPHCVDFKPIFQEAANKHSSVHFGAIQTDDKRCGGAESLIAPNLKGVPAVYVLHQDGKISEYKGDRSLEGLDELVKILS